MDIISQALSNARHYDPLFDSTDSLPVYCTHTPQLKPVSEWGHRLPHGVVVDGVVRRDFELRKPNVQLDLDVGALVSAANFSQHVGRRIAAVCATVCEEIAGVRMGKATQSALDFIGTMTPSDVIYILTIRACLKNRGMVPIPEVRVPCPHCGGIVGQLRHPPMGGLTVGVYEWTPGEPPTASVKLGEPIIHGGETIEAVAVQSVRWSMHLGLCEHGSAVLNNEHLRQLAIEGGIVGYSTTAGDAVKSSVPVSVLRARMTSWDAEAVGSAAYSTWGGLVFAVPTQHSCGETVHVPFDWRSRLL